MTVTARGPGIARQLVAPAILTGIGRLRCFRVADDEIVVATCGWANRSIPTIPLWGTGFDRNDRAFVVDARRGVAATAQRHKQGPRGERSGRDPAGK